MATYDYDAVVIGSGPAGQRAAIQSAKLGRRVMLVEKKGVVGGICINTGTIPSKTLRETVLHLSGYRERGIYGSSYTVKQHITMQDLHFRTDHVIRHEIDVTRHQLQRNKIEVMTGNAKFQVEHTVCLEDADGRGQRCTSPQRRSSSPPALMPRATKAFPSTASASSSATTFLRSRSCRARSP